MTGRLTCLRAKGQEPMFKNQCQEQGKDQCQRARSRTSAKSKARTNARGKVKNQGKGQGKDMGHQGQSQGPRPDQKVKGQESVVRRSGTWGGRGCRLLNERGRSSVNHKSS